MSRAEPNTNFQDQNSILSANPKKAKTKTKFRMQIILSDGTPHTVSYPAVVSGLGVPSSRNTTREQKKNIYYTSRDTSQPHTFSLQTLHGGWRKMFVNKCATIGTKALYAHYFGFDSLQHSLNNHGDAFYDAGHPLANFMNIK